MTNTPQAVASKRSVYRYVCPKRKPPAPPTLCLPKDTERQIVFATGSKVSAVPDDAPLYFRKQMEMPKSMVNEVDKRTTPYRFSFNKKQKQKEDLLDGWFPEEKDQQGQVKRSDSARPPVTEPVVSILDPGRIESARMSSHTRSSSPERTQPVNAAPLSTLIVRFQLKFGFPPYSLLEIRTIMARIGKVLAVIRLHINVVVVVFGDMGSAKRAVKSTHLGKPKCRLSCSWLYTSLDHPNLLATLMKVNPVNNRLKSALSARSPTPSPSKIPDRVD